MKIALSFLFILLSLGNQCSKELVDPAVAAAVLGKEFMVAVKGTAVLTASPEEQAPALTVQLEQVQDSRCPSDVICVTAGSAEATFTLTNPNGGSKTLTLCLGECRSGTGTAGGYKLTDEAEVTLGQEQFVVLLKDITPFPTTSRQDPEGKSKKAVLVITRK